MYHIWNVEVLLVEKYKETEKKEKMVHSEMDDVPKRPKSLSLPDLNLNLKFKKLRKRVGSKHGLLIESSRSIRSTGNFYFFAQLFEIYIHVAVQKTN